jgi:hypothetical protein
VTTRVSAHTATVILDEYPYPLDVTALSVSLDESRVPYADATIEAVLPDPGWLYAFDPLADRRLTITLTESFGAPFTLGDATANVLAASGTGPPPITLSDVTHNWGTPVVVLNFTVSLGRPFVGLERVPASVTITVNLFLRSRSINYGSATMTLTAESDESRLLDYRWTSHYPTLPDTLTVADACRLAISYACPGVTLQTTSTATTEAAAAVWSPGVSAWEYLVPLTASAGLRLWADELGEFHLERPDALYTGIGYALPLDAASTVVDTTDDTSRNGMWADGVVVTYRWTDVAGVRQTRYDVAGNLAASSKTVAVEYTDRPWPGPGEAAARLRKTKRQGRILSVDALANYKARPSQVVVFTAPVGAGLNYTGRVGSVQWRQPEDRMSVSTREPVTLGDGAIEPIPRDAEKGPHSWP